MPFPDGYAYVRGLVRHVHFKDARQDPLSGRRTWTISDGVIDWAGAIAALHADGYEGYISVETHVRPKIDGSRRTLARVQGLVADATRELALTGAGRAGSVP